MNKYFAISFLFCLLMCSCSKAPVITIYNDSLVTITNISLVGSGFSETIPSLEASKVISITVHPLGESALEIQFDTPSGRIKKDDLVYFEASGGYKVTLRINEGFEVISKSDLEA